MTAHESLVGELRGLFRHAPLSPTDLLTYAPNLTRTLDAINPEQALVRLWDVFDAFPGNNEVGAAAAVLGLTKTGNVLERLVEYAPEKNPRTVRRWAYEGLDKVAREIARSYRVVYANCELAVNGDVVAWHFDHQADMQEPVVERWQVPVGSDEEIIESIIDGDETSVVLPDGFESWLVLVTWVGEAVPTWSLRADRPLSAFATQSTFSIEGMA